MDRRVRLRRALGLGFVMILFGLDIYATGLLGGSERTLAVVRSIVLPGLPFLEWQLPLGLVTIGIAIASIAAWLRWGVDWLPVLVMSSAVAVTAFVMPLHHAEPDAGSSHGPAHHEHHGADEDTRSNGHPDGHGRPRPSGHPDAHGHAHPRGGVSTHVAPMTRRDETPRWIEASHEFTVVLVVFALVARLRLMFDRLPGAAWLARLVPAELRFPAVDHARAAALGLLSGAREPAVEVLCDPRLIRRAMRINRWARFRHGGDPLRGAHAPLRAGLSMAGMLDAAQRDALCGEARASLTGVPMSEPTWVRPFDGMLAACALAELGETRCVERWRLVFDERFGLRHGRRAAALHAPTMLAIGTAPAWEHAAATALARHMGWIGADDWQHLRRRCLGKAASGASDAESLRLVGAGLLWARLQDDAEALEILSRRTLSGDPIALALGDLACIPRASKQVTC